MLTRGTERFEYFGLRSRRSVFGRLNFGLKYTLVFLVVFSPCASVLAAFAACFFAFGSLATERRGRRWAQTGASRRVRVAWGATLAGWGDAMGGAQGRVTHEALATGLYVWAEHRT